jgi:N-acylglucosamine-6-phosphate 2-epimerase
MLKSFYKGLIVSCQSEGDDPFNKPEFIAAFAKAAEMGGAVAIRAEGLENIKAVKMKVNLPVIGITKGKFDDDWTLLTPDFSDIESLIKVGCEIVAIDATNRIRPNGLSGFDFLEEIKKRYKIPIIADISTFNEGIKAAELGADMIATTLSGYTPDSSERDDMHPDYELISELSSSIDVPVIAEGKIWSPTDAIKAIEVGAFAVVVGTAITRPRLITRMYSDALKSLRNPSNLLDK